jgi:hypothetical protein
MMMGIAPRAVPQIKSGLRNVMASGSSSGSKKVVRLVVRRGLFRS